MRRRPSIESRAHYVEYPAERHVPDRHHDGGSGILDLETPVPLPVFWTPEGDTDIATPSSIVDPEVSVRSRFIDHAAAIAMRAFAGVR